VRLGCDDTARRAAFEEQVRAELDPLPLRHEIVWR
jgi:hypothetical protein